MLMIKHNKYLDIRKAKDSSKMSASDANERLGRALSSLEGLSVGDAFGGFFEFASPLSVRARKRILPKPTWHYTDDTNMALSLFAILRQYGEVNQDQLATSLANHVERSRGYGLGTRAILSRIKRGLNFREVVQIAWGGGSYGNGGAGRAALVGAYFADDDSAGGLERIIEQARRATSVTHAHPESIAGAIAVAVATSWAWRLRNTGPDRQDFLDIILQAVPESEVRQGICRARDLPTATTLSEVVSKLGNGSKVSVQDTVPLALWIVCEYLNDYQEALWQAALAGGDVDTCAAIIGSIIVMFIGVEGIPKPWVHAREPLPKWALGFAKEETLYPVG
jgi:ADP-ribosylglycohydrolase